MREQLCAAFQAALEQLNQARAQEGESLARDVAVVAAMQDAVSIIEAPPGWPSAYADRLHARVAEELNAEAGMKEGGSQSKSRSWPIKWT